ncbi:hypothetical protein DYB31_012619, partial [Aphanomyces astaci]
RTDIARLLTGLTGNVMKAGAHFPRANNRRRRLLPLPAGLPPEAPELTIVGGACCRCLQDSHPKLPSCRKANHDGPFHSDWLRRIHDAVSNAPADASAALLTTVKDTIASSDRTNAAKIDRLNATNAALADQVHALLARLEEADARNGMREMQANTLKENSVLGDYKEVMAVQALFVVAMLGYCVWNARRGRSSS